MAKAIGSGSRHIHAGVLRTFVMHGTAQFCGALQRASANCINESITYDAQYELRTRGSWVRILPGAPPIQGCIPVTWVTIYTGDMGDTFGSNGLSTGSSRQAS